MQAPVPYMGQLSTTSTQGGSVGGRVSAHSQTSFFVSVCVCVCVCVRGGGGGGGGGGVCVCV